MNKLLLISAIVISAGLLHGMESLNDIVESSFVNTSVDKQNNDATIDYSTLPPITLPQIYHYFSENMNSDIAGYIFSLQPGSCLINSDLFYLDDEWYRTLDYEWYQTKATDVNEWINNYVNDCGYLSAMEHLNRNLQSRGMSIYDIKNENNATVLHAGCSTYNENPKTIKLYLRIAGNKVWKLLTAQTLTGSKDTHETALHKAVKQLRPIELVKLLLDAAGDNAWKLLAMKDANGTTVLHYVAHKDIYFSNQENLQKANLFIDAAGDKTWTLLTTGKDGLTPLHEAAKENNKEMVKFFLNAAGDKVQDYLTIKTERGVTAFLLATPEVRWVMEWYLKKKQTRRPSRG